MQRLLIVIRFALMLLSPAVVLVATVDGVWQGQTNSQWNTMGDDGTGWLTTSKDVVGGDGPRGRGDSPRRG